MAYNNLDNKIKAKLEQRNLTPSPTSWDKLSQQLDQNHHRSNRKFWLMGIAASFLGGIIIASFVLQTTHNSPSSPDSTTVVHNETEKGKTKGDQERFKIENKQQAITFERVNSEEKEAVKNTNQISEEQEIVALQKAKSNKSNYAASAPEAEVKNTPSLLIEERIIPKPQDKITSSAIAISSHSKIDKVGDAEIEKLLHQAQLEVRTAQILDHSTNKVDAQALLNGIEKDIDQSFKERIYLAIENGFTQVKSLVVNRNP